MTLKRLFVYVSLFFIVTLVGVPKTVFADDVRVGIGFALPPYVIKDSDQGLEVELIRKTLARAGHTAHFVYLPNLRLPVEFGNGNVDCIVTNSAFDVTRESGREAFYSDTTVTYQNYAITLKENDCTIDSVYDLADMRVLAFHNAVKYLGAEFAAMARNNDMYNELADQSLQIRMLYSKRVQVVVSDKRIFLWWRQKVMSAPFSGNQDMSQQLEFHAVFPPAPRRVSFHDQQLRDAFNAHFAKLREAGEVDVLSAKYLGFQVAGQ